MPPRKYHEAQAVTVFGEPWTRVHKWLDELAIVDGKLDVNHHRHRHHLDGVHEVERMWGETAGAVARQHIKADMGRIYTKEQVMKFIPDAPEWKQLDVLKAVCQYCGKVLPVTPEPGHMYSCGECGQMMEEK